MRKGNILIRGKVRESMTLLRQAGEAYDYHNDACPLCYAGRWDECEMGRRRRAAILSACDVVRERILRALPGYDAVQQQITEVKGGK